MQAIEAHKDIARVELAVMLVREHGASFARGTVHRFVVHHRTPLNKKPCTPPSRTGPTGIGRRPRAGAAGSSGRTLQQGHFTRIGKADHRGFREPHVQSNARRAMNGELRDNFDLGAACRLLGLERLLS